MSTIEHPELRLATRDDCVAVVGLWRECGLTRPWNDPDQDFARAIGQENSRVLVANEGDAIIGSVMAGYDGHRGWIYYLSVATAFRGRGIGVALCDAAVLWLRSIGAPKVQMMVREDNREMIAYYVRMGFVTQPVVTLGRFLTDDEKAAR